MMVAMTATNSPARPIAIDMVVSFERAMLVLVEVGVCFESRDRRRESESFLNGTQYLNSSEVLSALVVFEVRT